MRVTVEKVDDNENEYSDKHFNIDIEQLDINEKIFKEIAIKIKNDYNEEYANLITQFACVYLRIHNLISYLHNNWLEKYDVIDVLNKIKNEIIYLNIINFKNFKTQFLNYVDEKSNLHKIEKLEECIDDLYILVKNQNVDK